MLSNNGLCSHTACTAHAICSTSVQFCMASHFTKLHALSLASRSNLLLTHCYAALLWRNKFQWHGTIQLASCWALLYSVFNLIIVPCISSFISSFVSVVAAKQLKKLATKVLGWNTACYVGKLCPLKYLFPETDWQTDTNKHTNKPCRRKEEECKTTVEPNILTNILANHAGGRKREERSARLQWNQTY